ncbi:MAG: hypothetical protein IPF92_22025 [Myxococcales bacterium]|jgi:hypothetical protein|nr:hypothetical protein [Myxococcales bacterium]MBL0194519.1 hypothetical protein [Myxococcales bacterium]HQY61290.1 hypothetical protein [Polyangiaceae bacterium]
MRHILLAAAALLVTASAACADPSTVPDGFTSACEPVVGLRLAAGLRPAKDVDFVGFRTESTQLVESSAGSPATDGPCPAGAACPPRPTTPSAPRTGWIAQWSARFSDDVRGVPCSGASDRPTCERRVAELRLIASECDGFSVVPKVAAPGGAVRSTGECTMSYLVYTRGDEVGTVSTDESARTFLGDINSPQEAILLAKLGGEAFSCDATSPAAYAPASDGYELSSSKVSVDPSGTPVACRRRILQVTKDGVVRFLRQEDC